LAQELDIHANFVLKYLIFINMVTGVGQVQLNDMINLPTIKILFGPDSNKTYAYTVDEVRPCGKVLTMYL